MRKDTSTKINIYIIFNIIIYIIILINFTHTSCKKQDSPGIIVPETLSPFAEDDPDSSAEVTVKLSHAADNEVSVFYATESGTASAGRNFVHSGGRLVFKPGEISKNVSIEIIHDTVSKQDVSFRINFSEPVNSVLSGNITEITIMNVDFAGIAWSDEFNANLLNTQDWNYEKGAGGWGNNELQTYTNSTENVHIDSGYLHITANNPANNYFTSGRITTLGKRTFTYGRIEIRARLPEGKGIWPALWMLGAGFPGTGWPACGETDIMELLGHEPSKIYGTVHWDSNGHKSRSGTSSLINDKFSNTFHIFSLIRSPNNLRWLIDGKQFFRLNSSEINGFPVNSAQFLIFNIAVGGNWPGRPDGTTEFPQNMIIDYVRFYQ